MGVRVPRVMWAGSKRAPLPRVPAIFIAKQDTLVASPPLPFVIASPSETRAWESRSSLFPALTLTPSLACARATPLPIEERGWGEGWQGHVGAFRGSFAPEAVIHSEP